MSVRKRLAFLLAGMLLLQMLCLPVFAVVEPELSIGYDMSAGLVNVNVTGLEAGSMVSLMGFYDGELDYLDQYTASAEGAIGVTYPSSAVWAAGGVIEARVGGQGGDSLAVELAAIVFDGPRILELHQEANRMDKLSTRVTN